MRRLRDALAPWEAEHTYLNFAESGGRATTLFSSASYHRLRRIKAIVDPPHRLPPSPAFCSRALGAA